VDLLQIHSANPQLLEAGEVQETMVALRDEGKARFLGFSSDVETARLGIRIGGWDVVQVPYSILNPGADEHLFAEAQAAGVGVLLMRSLAGGKLTAKYQRLPEGPTRQVIEALLGFTDPVGDPDALAALALRYALTPEAVSTVLLGTRRPETLQYARNAALAGPLAPKRVGQIRNLITSSNLTVW
jgi:aryl-alcohol dehydrogenase-like predicted oxidoreductase